MLKSEKKFRFADGKKVIVRDCGIYEADECTPGDRSNLLLMKMKRKMKMVAVIMVGLPLTMTMRRRQSILYIPHADYNYLTYQIREH